MPRRIAISNVNARTIDILNTIRANASAEYQSLVPEVATETDIPKVGEVLYGYPAMANQFLSSLVNRIALVSIKGAVFNNAYAELKKGYLEFGETVEEVFVNICKAREFSAEKGEAREFKRTLPDVRSAFHTMNWRVQYPITVQQEDLRMAFTSTSGVTDLIAMIINQVYTSAEYDEYLLFKYLIIKAVSHGKMYPVAFDSTDMKNAAKSFRGLSNQLQFMSNKYNDNGVTTTTPKADQFIFMDSMFNAGYDVDVLASAFNMDKATFSGKLKLIDDFTTFDNERFAEIRQNSDMIEEVTDAELALMADVKAVLVDKEWFQVYDNLNTMTETFVSSGLYWNYFYNVWKTVSFSPFSNAIVFVDDGATVTVPDTFKVEITGKSVGEGGTIFTLEPEFDSASLQPSTVEFVQNQGCTAEGVAVHKYGAVIMPPNANAVGLEARIGNHFYLSTSNLATTADVSDELTFNEVDFIADTLSALSITNVTIAEEFLSTKLNYTGTGDKGDSAVITATPTSEDATVSMKYDGVDVVSSTITLAEGAKDLEITVTGFASGAVTTKKYVVKITAS